MPYTIEERNELDFYKSFVSELRNAHINAIKEFIPNKFRDNNRVLQSFEDILSGLGLEDANLEDGGVLYENILFNPNMEGMSEEKTAEIMAYYDSVRNSMLTIQDKKLKKYVKSELLNKTVERNFTELMTTTISTLPDPIPEEVDDDGNVITEAIEVKEGDIIATGTGKTLRIWLIQGAKKRRFISTNDFYSSKYYDRAVKSLPIDFINSIDTGTLIILESETPFRSVITPPAPETNVVDEPYRLANDDDRFGGS